MPVLNIALISGPELARSLGKREDSRDIDHHIHREPVVDGKRNTLSFMRPLNHPEKIRPLLMVLDNCQVAVVEVTKLDSSFGEVLVASACASVGRGYVILAPSEDEWIDQEQVETLLEAFGLNDWTVFSDGNLTLREKLLADLEAVVEQSEALVHAPLVIPINQQFTVTGVGLVALGHVATGTINKHDTIQVHPSREHGVIRSIQVMDDDVDTAKAGDRVGLALRNLEERALRKGSILTKAPQPTKGSEPPNNPLTSHDVSTLKVVGAAMQKRQLESGDVVHVVTEQQFISGRLKQVITEGEVMRMKIEWEHPLLARTECPRPLLISQLDSKPHRIIGTGKLVDYC